MHRQKRKTRLRSRLRHSVQTIAVPRILNGWWHSGVVCLFILSLRRLVGGPDGRHDGDVFQCSISEANMS